jgi:hypothetical protein
MTRKWSESPSFFIRQPWTGRADLRTERAAELAKEWLRRKKGPVVAGSEAINTALCAIEELKKIHQYLRVAIVVPSRTLIYQWSERIQEFFGFPERVVGFVDGECSDDFSKWTRILVCTAAPGLKLLAEKCDSFIGRDLLLIGHDLNHSQLHTLLAVPHAYSLILLENDAELTVHDYYCCADEDSEPGGPLSEESAVASATQLLNCTNLQDCDAYFSAMLTKDMLIGDIEISEEELDHLASLIIAELKKPLAPVKESLSVAVFLVWVGIRYYQEGNFWTPVYKKLGLPMAQAKWQAILGEAFLGTVRKHGLLEIVTIDKQPYMTPILAHGHVPDYYLDSYFEDVVFAIYKDLVKNELAISQKEVERLISIWRDSYEGFQKERENLKRLEDKEEQLMLFQKTLANFEVLQRYQMLQKDKKDSPELTTLLELPESWLADAEAEKQRLQLNYNELCDLKEREQKIAESMDFVLREKEELEKHANEIAQGYIVNWSYSFSDSVADNALNTVQDLLNEFITKSSVFRGLLGKLLRILQPKRYRNLLVIKQRIQESFLPMQLSPAALVSGKTTGELLKAVKELRSTLTRRREILNTIQELEQASREAAVAASTLTDTGIDDLKERLDTLSESIAEYKMNIVKLGRGKYDKGIEELQGQRIIHQEMSAIRTQVNNDLDRILSCLPSVINYKESELRNSLVRVRKQVAKSKDKLKIYTNPLYMLIESTKAFILQGEGKAVSFLYNSLLLMEALDKDIAADKVRLPARIAQAIIKWWETVGHVKIEEFRTEKAIIRTRERGPISLRRPHIFLDVVGGELKVKFPSQLVEQGRARVTVQAGAKPARTYYAPMLRVKGGYQTQEIEISLEAPEITYKIEFSCDDVTREWEFSGPGWDKFSLLFNGSRYLVEENRLPDGEAWIIAPSSFRIEPAGNIREQFKLRGKWSDFVCANIDLDGVEIVLVRDGRNLDIFRRQAQLDPTLIGGDLLLGVQTRDGSPVYSGELPGLVFSVRDREELGYYGIHYDKEKYVPISELNPIVNKDNSVYINLMEVLGEKYGSCKPTLTYRVTKAVLSESFAFVPDLNISFNKRLYAPGTAESEVGRVTVSSSVPFALNVDLPARILGSSQGKSLVEFDAGSSASLFGDIEFDIKGTKTAIGLRIDVPCVRWQLSGEDWRDMTEEVWHEEIGEIEVKLPFFYNGHGRLSLSGGQQKIDKHFKHGVASFDLRKFADTIRESDNPVHDVILELPDVDSLLLLKIRSVWQVAKVEFQDMEADGIREIRIKWEDWGRAKDRVVRLWPLGNLAVEMIQCSIADGDSEVVIVNSIENLPAGRYRLQFDIDDPWSVSEPVCPEQGAHNCKDVAVGLDLSNVLTRADRLEIEFFESNRQLYIVDRKYWIQDIALAPEHEGEKRYKGKVLTSIKGRPTELECNPVSFYYDDGFLPFLIDYDGDGSMYCARCRRFFWEVEHHCPKHYHIEPEAIFVRRRAHEPGSPEGD